MGSFLKAAYIGRSNMYTNVLELTIIYESITANRAININASLRLLL